MTETLLPCPFCGGAPKLRAHRSGEDAMEAYVECPSCEVRTTYYEDAYAPTADAIAAWNRRASLPTSRAHAYPQELTDELRDVLSLMMWNTGPIAHALRFGGSAIPPKAELEQAHVLHWLTLLVLTHGRSWREKAQERINEIRHGATPEVQP